MFHPFRRREIPVVPILTEADEIALGPVASAELRERVRGFDLEARLLPFAPRKHRQRRNQVGATLVEYALLLALIAFVCVISLSLLGKAVSAKFSTIGASLSGTTATTTPPTTSTTPPTTQPGNGCDGNGNGNGHGQGGGHCNG